MPAPRWALITGVSPGGLGEAEALAFLRRGINVIVTSLERIDLQFLKPDEGSDYGFLLRLQLDITSSRSIYDAVQQVENLTDGRLDFLINNAGYAYYMPLMDVNIKEAKRQFNVNVWGTLQVTQAFFPLLYAARGTVVNQASVAGMEGYNEPFTGIYSSSNAALISLSHAMRAELACLDVKVVTLVTSNVRTDFLRNTTGFLKTGLDPVSDYFPVRDKADKRLRDPNIGSDRHKVAENTVDELLKQEKPTVVRQGYRMTLIWLMLRLLPQWILDAIAMHNFGLYALNVDEVKKRRRHL